MIKPCEECNGTGGWKPCWGCELERREIEKDMKEKQDNEEMARLEAIIERSKQEKESLDRQAAPGGESSRQGIQRNTGFAPASREIGRIRAASRGGSGASVLPEILEEEQPKPSRNGKERAVEPESMPKDGEDDDV
jgi:hypothetical protein